MYKYLMLLLFLVAAFASSGWHTGMSTAGPLGADTLPRLPKSGGVNARQAGENRRTAPGDTAPPPRIDSNRNTQRIDTLRISKDSLNAPVEYSAEDSGVILIPSKEMYLYGKASASQADVKLTANTIAYDQASQVVKAYGNTDTSQQSLTNRPTIVQGGSTSINDTIFFNLNSQRGLLKNSYYQEGEMFVNAQRIKREDAKTAYAFKTLFTTCNLDTPHFAIKSRKVKLITGKLAVTGPAFPEFEGVPMPVAIPFGLFPLNRGRSSGILPPQFAANNQAGLGLEGLGYYKAINDYVDVTVRGNLYSYGGYNFNISPRYFKRYRYNGNLDFGFQNNKLLNENYIPVQPGRPVIPGTNDEFIRNTGFQVRWSHAQDMKARPGVTFNASVNAGSTRFNQFVLNNAIRNAQNSLQSGINYGRTWADGKYVLQLNASHSQNSVNRLINVTLPNATFTATTLYPFAKKESVGSQKWYEKLGVSYTGTFANNTAFYDTNVSLRKILDTAQWGATHQLPLTLALPALGPVIVSPGISYSERWYGSYMEQRWNNDSNRIDTRFRKGFFAAREVNLSLNASSRIFGTVNFRGGSRVKAIRHEIKPSLGFSYRPDLNKRWYYEIQEDSSGRRRIINPFERAAGGGYSIGDFGGLTFSLQNLLEMKVRDKDDSSAKADKKVRLIDGFDISTAYNLIADSFALSDIQINLRSTLWEKVNITGTATLDPYARSLQGFRVNRYTTPSLAQANLALSTSLTGGKNDEKKGDKPLPEDPSMTVDQQLRQLEFVRANPAEFVDFEIPWTLSLSAVLNYSRIIIPGTYRFRGEVNANVNVNGDFSLTPKWKLGGSTFYDFRTGQISNLSMFITREMHCWQLAVNVNLGQFQSFNITVNPKSGILRDLRINRSRFFYNQ